MYLVTGDKSFIFQAGLELATQPRLTLTLILPSPPLSSGIKGIHHHSCLRGAEKELRTLGIVGKLSTNWDTASVPQYTLQMLENLATITFPSIHGSDQTELGSKQCLEPVCAQFTKALILSLTIEDRCYLSPICWFPLWLFLRGKVPVCCNTSVSLPTSACSISLAAASIWLVTPFIPLRTKASWARWNACMCWFPGPVWLPGAEVLPACPSEPSRAIDNA